MDVIMFMGQSNIAGRGDSKEKLPLFMGADFRAVSDPERLYPIADPFGVYENRTGGIDDGAKKTGSMVPAFVRRYYEKTGRQVLAVSASQGGTSSELWRDVLVQDAAERLKAALEYCRKQMIPVEHVWILWCQGETDGDHAVSAEEYKKNFQMIWSEMKSAGAETCFLFQIGHFNYVKHPEGLYGLSGQELDAQYQVIRTAQEQICRDCKDVVWAASFEQYLHGMKDHFHYRQQVYHEVGERAAEVVSKAVGN